MSAYAAAYAPPPGGYGGYARGSAAAPKSYSPPGVPSGAAPGAAAAAGRGKGGFAEGFTYSGLSPGGVGWPTPEQMVASVPVRPCELTRSSEKVTLGSAGAVNELRGTVPKPYKVGEEAEFVVLEHVLSDTDVAEIVATGSKVLSDLISTGLARDPDPVDGRPSFAVDLVQRGVHGEHLKHVLTTLSDKVLLPYIRSKYGCPNAALATARFRRLMQEERVFVPPHHEHGALVVASIGLQDPQSFTGGLFVQGSGRAFLDRKFVPLGRGDVCLHQHDLHHGLEVQEGLKYELVLIFKDSQKAAADGASPWYLKSAEAGDASAQYGCALSSLGAKDYKAAGAWLEKASAQDQPEALYTLAELLYSPPAGSAGSALQEDTARALQLLRRGAELGHGRSQSRLGALLSQGVKGRVQQDSWEGKRLLRLAFEQDDPDAAFHLGQLLLQEGDRDGATKLLAACAKGHPRACFQVAEMYREGQYQFSKDEAQSLRYTKWAAHQGDSQALSNLGHLIINGMGVVRDESKAVRLFRHSAKLGAAEGQLNYGLALLRGNGGVKVDYQEALEWAQKSAAQGHALAHQQLPMFFSAARNPNPPARSLPNSQEELRRLGIKELRDLLRAEGIDYSDCVEKADLVARAAQHLPGVAEPWDPAPEHTLLLEPKRSLDRAELVKQRQSAATAATPAVASPAKANAVPTTSSPVAKQAAEQSGAAASSQPAAATTPAAAPPKPKDEEYEFID
mmetsp:Transcript_4045/g.9496  ORF Transcript_4045/g.9496 Transcript_4045/m.9496 type:complete len:735 (-) Transcript_4045:83-2287(-)